MFLDYKYIIVDNGESGTEIPIIFSYRIAHSNIAQGYVGKVVSAGFCQIFADGVNLVSVAVFGKSDSLKMESRGFVDAEIIKKELNR